VFFFFFFDVDILLVLRPMCPSLLLPAAYSAGFTDMGETSSLGSISGLFLVSAVFFVTRCV